MASGVPTNRTNITLPADVSAEIIKKTQTDSAIMQLARQITLPGRGLAVPVISADPEASWVGETAKKPVVNPTVGTKMMQPYKLAVIVPFSNEFRRDANALYNALVNRLPLALAKKFDETVVGGVTPGTGFDVLTSCQKQEIGTDAYAGLVAADADIAENGGDLNGIALAPAGKAVLLGSTDRNGRPLFINNAAEGAIPYILGAPTYISKGVEDKTADVVGVAGDWTQAMYGTVEGVQIDISDQATLTTGTQEAPVQINLFQQNMFAVRAEIELGFIADTSCFNLLTAEAESDS